MIKTINPATMEILKEYTPVDNSEIPAIIERSKNAQVKWAELSIREREKFLFKAYEYLIENIDEYCEVIQKNNGKPKNEALNAEVYPVAALLLYFSKKAHKILKTKKIPLPVYNLLLRFSEIHYEPLGVIGVISPWNFPFTIPAGQIAMALVAGNTVIHKPASATMYIGEWIDKLFNEGAGLPKDVFITLYGSGSAANEMIKSGKLNKVMFTGSVGVGKQVMKTAAEELVPVNLELGGKDPMIVCKDADVKVAAKGAVWGAFFNCGQVCASIERVYVAEEIATEFTSEVISITKKLRIGEDLDVGPMTADSQLKQVTEHVEDAVKRGAKILSGGKIPSNSKGLFFEPTILTNIDHTFTCVMEETFGPTMPIMHFKTEEEAIKLANDSPFALTASVWSKDIGRAKKIALKVNAGTVTINEHAYTHGIAETPWGGSKHSGFGRSHAKMGLLELVEAKHIHTNYLSFLPSFWWFGYSKDFYNTMKTVVKPFAEGPLGLMRILPTLIKLFSRKLY